MFITREVRRSRETPPRSPSNGRTIIRAQACNRHLRPGTSLLSVPPPTSSAPTRGSPPRHDSPTPRPAEISTKSSLQCHYYSTSSTIHAAGRWGKCTFTREEPLHHGRLPSSGRWHRHSTRRTFGSRSQMIQNTTRVVSFLINLKVVSINFYIIQINV